MKGNLLVDDRMGFRKMSDYVIYSFPEREWDKKVGTDFNLLGGFDTVDFSLKLV